MVNEYEVEVSLTSRYNKETQTVTSTVYAYQISDVPTQAIYAVMRDRDPEEWEFKILSLGPPKRLVEMAAKQVELMLSKAMASLTEAARKK